MSPFTDIDSSPISWREAGSGDAVIFLHPIIGTREYWDVQLLSLSDSWRCVAWDAPGYGGSAAPTTNDQHGMARRLVEFVEILGVQSAHLVGLSLGGMHALNAVNFAPDRFGRIVLADTSAAFGADPDVWLAEWLGRLEQGSPASFVGEVIDSIVHTPVDQETRNSMVAAFERVSSAGFVAASQYLVAHDLRLTLGEIANECLVIVGEHDDETPKSYSEELVGLLPNAPLEVIAGAGHLPSVETPDAFNRLVRDFLSE